MKDLNLYYGTNHALKDVNMEIRNHAVTAFIGPSGCGKSTFLKCINRMNDLVENVRIEGKVLLDGKDLTGKKNIEISKAGIARTFQNIRLFKELTVLDNVKVGLHNHHHYSTIEGILRLPNYRKVEKEMNEKAMELLKVFDLEKFASYKAEIGRAHV